MEFIAQYSKIKTLAQPELAIIEKLLVNKISVKEPLQSSIKNFLLAPSKRIRPVLGLLLLKAYEYDICDNQLEFLSVIELVHSASLIHDDIIDECDTRRGEKTIASKFNNKLGIISGDYLLSVAMEKLLNIADMKLVKMVIKTINNMCQGEVNQNFNKFKIGTIEEYIDKTKNKTAYLFETTLMGAMLLQKQIFDEDKISSLGLNIGIAFQIRDDLINLIQTNNDKPSQNDVKQGIYNAPIIFSSDVENYSKGIEKTIDLLNNYIDNARKTLKILPNNEYSAALDNFLELLKNV